MSVYVQVQAQRSLPVSRFVFIYLLYHHYSKPHKSNPRQIATDPNKWVSCYFVKQTQEEKHNGHCSGQSGCDEHKNRT